jgi:hypothetical protein
MRIRFPNRNARYALAALLPVAALLLLAGCGGGGSDPSSPDPCIDNDGDGYGNPGSANCRLGSQTDCDDNDPDNFPGNQESCADGSDNDCDTRVDCNDSECASDPACTGEQTLIARIENSTGTRGYRVRVSFPAGVSYSGFQPLGPSGNGTCSLVEGNPVTYGCIFTSTMTLPDDVVAITFSVDTPPPPEITDYALAECVYTDPVTFNEIPANCSLRLST